MNNEELVVKIKQGHNEFIPELWQNTYKLVYMLAKQFLTPHYNEL